MNDCVRVGQAIGQVLSLGVGVALSPVAIIAVVLILATPRARVNGPVFLVGWLGGMLIASGLALALSNGADATSASKPADWVGWLKIALGVLLCLLAARQWGHRSEDHEAPRWMQALDAFNSVKVMGLAAVPSSVNPLECALPVQHGGVEHRRDGERAKR
jgi:hypothetical protein